MLLSVVDCDVGHACCWLLPQALARFVLDTALNKVGKAKEDRKGCMRLQLFAYMRDATPFALAISTKILCPTNTHHRLDEQST
jgi:hypothetical protein